ncbi:MAG: 2-dehydropantoate 2-reductase [Lachnospiraceae bacterium]|nr:2-dehydropantoate 2-reductase [Lachnospiraceae bacterium]
MQIYVDFDDCLCETGKAFSRLVFEMYGKQVPYEEMNFFNLQKSFALTDEEYDNLLVKGHEAEVLLSIEETPGAASVINEWLDRGHQVSVITGRPFNAFEASRQWLDTHGFERVKLFCLNKYGRENFLKGSDFSLELEDYLKMHFDYAIEDSTSAFKFFDHLPDLNVLVIDRPWNREAVFPNDHYRRVYDWETIREIVGKR